MCGIAGIVRADRSAPVEEAALLRMARALRHRGPDGYGLSLEPGAGLVSTRLAIVDEAGGWQPARSPGGSLLVYNGEVYNHPELRGELERRGERFAGHGDTEVVLRLLERDGLGALPRLNGQFAIAWWQPDERRLTLVRDRFGVRPLHFSLLADGSLAFGSEAKALFASGAVAAAPDLRGLEDVFTLWGPRAPRTPFAGVQQPAPGALIVWEDGRVVARRSWWEPELGAAGGGGEDELAALLADSVRLRLRADVPVGAYLSGGLDSSLTAALARQRAGAGLQTFSVAFADPAFDERRHQEAVADALGTRHHALEIAPSAIAEALPEVVLHAEAPLVRTAPAPLYLLARHVRERGLKVVVTGEGADELFWGYDLFKEVALRELHERDPVRAAAMLDRLYPYLAGDAARRGPAWRRFILQAGTGGDPLRSHRTRAEATAAVKAFLAPDVAAELAADPLDDLRARLPAGFGGWSPLERASWLEVTTLLSPYLLSAQGDRMSMAHGVEGRYPFLDHRVFELAAGLAPERKLDGLRDKVALRELARPLLGSGVAERPKQPYRAPEVAPFFGPLAPAWVSELLSAEGLAEAALFDERPVAALRRRCAAGRVNGIRESMALVAIVTTGLWHRAFFGPRSRGYEQETAAAKVRLHRTEHAVGQEATG